MIRRLQDPELFKYTVKRIPEYVEENSVRDLVAAIGDEIRGEIRNRYAITETSEGFSLNYDNETIVLPKRGDFAEILQTDIISGYLENNNLEEGDRVLDAGSYPGEFSVYAANKVGPSGKVVAMEPDPSNLEHMRNVAQINDVDNLEIVPRGLFNFEGTASFNVSPANLGSGIDQSGEIEVPVTTLDRVNREHGPFDLIKMDIEGAEIQALLGGEEAIQEYRPAFAIASYHKVDGKETAESVEEMLISKDYDVETGYPQHQTTWAWD